MGKYLVEHGKKENSLVKLAYEHDVPIFCPAFVDSSAGFGLVKHQVDAMKAGKPYMVLDAIADFRELTDIKIKAGTTGLLMIGGGVPKNFIQDTVVCAEILGHDDVEVHKYAVQITVADVRDGACSSSTLQEAASWGKVNTGIEQMVFAEAGSVMPLLPSRRLSSRPLEEPREAPLGQAVRLSRLPIRSELKHASPSINEGEGFSCTTAQFSRRSWRWSPGRWSCWCGWSSPRGMRSRNGDQLGIDPARLARQSSLDGRAARRSAVAGAQLQPPDGAADDLLRDRLCARSLMGFDRAASTSGSPGAMSGCASSTASSRRP